MKMSESTVNITKALIQFTMECPNVEKKSDGYNYKYANLTETLNTIRPILSKLGLWVGQNNHHTDTHVGVSTLIHHTSGEYIHFDPVMIPIEEVSKGKNIAQETGTDITYARRYSLCTALNLAMEDTDGVKPSDGTKKQTNSYTRDSSSSYGQKKQYGQSNSWAKNEKVCSAEQTDLPLKQLDQRREMKRFFGITSGLTEKQQKALMYYHCKKSSRAALSAEEYKELNDLLECADHQLIVSMIRKARLMKLEAM
jgi:hypothetical protein